MMDENELWGVSELLTTHDMRISYYIVINIINKSQYNIT